MTPYQTAIDKGKHKKRVVYFTWYFGVGIGFRFQSTNTRFDWYSILLPFVVIEISSKNKTLQQEP